jgi:hypothetical protein
MSNNQMPCRDCITLGMCKADYSKNKSILSLMSKCSLILNYVNNNKVDVLEGKYWGIRRFFTGEDDG